MTVLLKVTLINPTTDMPAQAGQKGWRVAPTGAPEEQQRSQAKLI